ncbi:MAG TPA: HisA/HisF-related TIM barrel protein, partial [Xylella taiwanensis]
MSFIVYPALDIRDGAVVRLRQGDYARETRYDDQVLPRAQTFAESGATWMHLVDLDAAKAGGYTLMPLLHQITHETGLRVQTGGGVRSRDDVARILDAGAARVVIGSLAVRETAHVIDWLQAFGPERITVALDTRQDAGGVWRLPV